jgi:hypothetical protein
MLRQAFRSSDLFVLVPALFVACTGDGPAARSVGVTGGMSGAVTTMGGSGLTPAASSGGARGSGDGTGGNSSGGTVIASGGSAAGATPGAGGVAANAGGVNGAGGAESGDGGTPGDAGAGVRAARPIQSPPTYRGTVNNAVGCSHDYATHGFEPDDPAGTRHPLFLYFTGTNFVSDEASFRDQSAPAANAVTKAMAGRGFVALWVEYDNGAIAWLGDHVAQLDCLFGKDPTTILAVACALPQVDCARGIATWGHSQGAYVAHSAYDFDDRVRAAWLAGYGGDAQSTMPKNRLRVENGEGDTTNGQVATVNRVAGLTTAECPDDGRSQCFRADGSGWVIVRAKDCVTSTADHCWFDKKTCTDSQVVLEPNWVDPASTKPFALESNADWVAKTVVRP